MSSIIVLKNYALILNSEKIDDYNEYSDYFDMLNYACSF